MREENCTSLELSKWLKENECKLSEKHIDDNWVPAGDEGLAKYNSPPSGWIRLSKKDELVCAFNAGFADKHYPAYDILNDICLKYRFEFFGDNDETQNICYDIFSYMLSGEKEKAEEIIKDNCIFNPTNQ